MIKQDPPISASAEADLERRLRALPPAPGPDPRFRAELRVQLLAAVERGPQPETASVATGLHLAGGRHAAAGPRRPGSSRNPRFALPGARASRSALTGAGPVGVSGAGVSRPPLPGALARRLRRFSFSHLAVPGLGRRALGVLGAALAVVLVITGSTYWLAQRALPGDALYGLKRVGETVDLSTKDGDVSRGSAYLSLSTTRIDEAAALVKRATSAAEPGISQRTGLSAAGPLSPHVDELVRDVLVDGDTSAVTATRLLTTASVSNRAQNPVTSVATWLSDQRGKVGVLVARLPETGPTTAGGAARTLQRDLVAIQARVKAITTSVQCGTCRFTKSDRLGPLPCRTCPTAVRGSSPTSTAPTTSPRHRPSTTVVTTTPASPTVVPTTPGVVTTGSTTPTTSPPASPAPAPTTPEPTPVPTTPTPTTSPPDPGSTTPTPTTAPTPSTDPPTSTEPSFDPSCLPGLCTSPAVTPTS